MLPLEVMSYPVPMIIRGHSVFNGGGGFVTKSFPKTIKNNSEKLACQYESKIESMKWKTPAYMDIEATMEITGTQLRTRDRRGGRL